MQGTKLAVGATLMFGLTLTGVRGAAAQKDPFVASSTTPSKLSTTPVIGQPYSATKYVRTVKTLPNGRQVTINEGNPWKVARDAQGRVVVDHQPECPLDPPARAWCGTHEVILFDPKARTITPWLWGANAGPGATLGKITAAQLEEAVTKLAVEEKPSEPGWPQPSVTTEDLGQQVIEGVPVNGVRTTTVVSTGYSGNDAPITTNREVWTSAEMKLVMKVVTTDPRTGVRTVGLEDFSRHAGPALFRPPANYALNSTKYTGTLADNYVKKLAEGEAQ